MAVVGVGSDDPLWPVMASAARQAADRRASGKPTIRVVAPETASVHEQKNILRRLWREGMVAACVQVTDPDGLRDTLDELVLKGVRVVTMMRPVTADPPLSHAGPNNEAIGEAAARAVCEATGGKGLAAVLHADSVDPVSVRRRAAFTRRLASCPEVRVLRELDCKAEPDNARRLLRETTERFPRIDVWVALGDWPLRGADPSIRLLPDGCRLVTVDALPQYLVLLETGAVHALVASDYQEMVNRAILAAAAELAGGRRTAGHFDAPVAIVTRDNLARFKRGGVAEIVSSHDDR